MFRDIRIKLEINNKIYGELLNIQKLSNALLISPWVKEKIIGKSRKYFELKDYEAKTL